jgi:hypothetical protein
LERLLPSSFPKVYTRSTKMVFALRLATSSNFQVIFFGLFKDLKSSHAHERGLNKRDPIERNIENKRAESKNFGSPTNVLIQNKLDDDLNLKGAHDHRNEHIDESDTEGHHSSDSHSSIGLTLVLGFIFMLVVDQIGGKLHHTSCKLPYFYRLPSAFHPTHFVRSP